METMADVIQGIDHQRQEMSQEKIDPDQIFGQQAALNAMLGVTKNCLPPHPLPAISHKYMTYHCCDVDCRETGTCEGNLLSEQWCFSATIIPLLLFAN